MKLSEPYVKLPFHSLRFPKLIICPFHPARRIVTQNMSLPMFTGQGSSDHAFRNAIPDLDHLIPPTPPNLRHVCAAGFNLQVLVVGTHPASRGLSGLVFPSHLGVRLYRTRGRGCLCNHPRAQASHAVAHRGECTLKWANCYCACAAEP